MTIETDFVTTSSSTNFIVMEGRTILVAKKIFEEMLEQRGNTFPKDQKRIIKKWFKNNKSFNGNLILPWSTTKYNIYIYRLEKMGKDQVIVDTCGNNSFEDVLDDVIPIQKKVPVEDSLNLSFLDLSDMKEKTRYKREKEDFPDPTTELRVFDIFFHDLNEDAQKRLLEEFETTEEEENWEYIEISEISREMEIK